MKKLTLLIVLFITMAGAYAQQFSLDTVYFQFDRSDLAEKYKTQLDSIVEDVSEYPSFFIQVYGHTDSIGSPAYNLALSEARAREIALYLREKGIHLSRIEYEGLGTSKPVNANDTYAGRRSNRRADIAVIFSREPYVAIADRDTVRDSLEVAAPVEIPPSSITDTIYCDYNPFLINPAHKTVIIAPEGTKVIVPPDAFDTDLEEITFEVKELFYRSDMILNAMSTTSKEGPLEAVGIFSVDAKAGRRPAKLFPDMGYTVELPATRRDREMGVYLGSGRGGPKGKNKKNITPITFNAVQNWREDKGKQVRYKGRDKSYSFEVQKGGRYTVARPLHHSQNTDPEDKGMDIFVKFKGKRFERSTIAMVVGEVVKTYIPLKKNTVRKYEATRVKFLDPKTKLVLVAVQFDDQGNPYLAKRSFQPGQLIKDRKRDTRKNSKSRPSIKMKIKFRKMTKERLVELLTELNV